MSSHASAELLSAYLDRQLVEPEVRQLEEHLDRCEHCHVRLQGLRKVVTHLQNLDPLTPPSALEAAVARRIQLTDRRPNLLDRFEQGISIFDRQSPLLAMFAVIIALALFIYLFSYALHQDQSGSVEVIFKDPPGAVAAPDSGLSERWQRMNQPVEPFRILGNLYYVGASSVTSFLITTPTGHILIDGGFEQTVPLIEASIERLGFRIEDVEILLNSHAHFDHAGGLARLKEKSGARFMASELDAPILERGGLGDDLLGDEASFPPVRVDRRLKDGDIVELGGTRLAAHVTAGHTRGCTSWAFEVEDAGSSRLAVSICSLSVLEGMKFGEQPTYPTIAEDFERSFETLESLPCDVFLASHAGFFEMAGKQERLGEDGPNPFIDRAGYLSYIERARERFEEAVAKEKAGDPG